MGSIRWSETLKFSVVIPIKDEVDLIPVTLPSWYSLNPDEVVLCLDRPAPKNVVESINEVASKLDAKEKTKVIEVERNPSYKFHQANVRRWGFREARNDTILTGDIDTIVSSKLGGYLGLIGETVKLVSFSKLGFPPTFRNGVTWFIHMFYPHESFTGLYAFSKEAWLETENMKSLERIHRGEDTHLHEAIKRKYKTRFISGIKNLVLRPHESKKYQYLMGYNRWMIRKASIFRVALSSVVYLRPHMFVGYLKARLR